MKFNRELSIIQQKMATSSAGVNRRQAALKALNLETGQTVLDVGCGGGHLLEDISLAVGEKGLVYGLDPSEVQIKSAQSRCKKLKNVKLICNSASKIDLTTKSCDSVASIQTLEYIKNLDSTLEEITRVLKNNSMFINVSVLWDHFKFHGPENKLNNLMHEAFKSHCFHQMIPMVLGGKLKNLGFKNIKNHELSFLITKRHKNSPAVYAEMILSKHALKQGISEEKVLDWQKQLEKAEKNKTYGFTSFPVLTVSYLI
ncbi:MAG: methyltransferase domain-containing protein [Paracoccaceae bacterium]|nr:methyltransferase domain-containing protein [Paracoccaceae bacterium]